MTGEIKSEKWVVLFLNIWTALTWRCAVDKMCPNSHPDLKKAQTNGKKKKTTSQTETDTFIFFINSFDNRILKPQTRLCLQVNN